MKHIIVDLEMNAVAKNFREERKVCSMEVIEIGAVALDEDYKEIAEFKTFVKPQYNSRVEKVFEDITGITTEMLEEAPFFEFALREFFCWCKNLEDDIQVYQWSESDLEQLLKEICLKEISLNAEEMEFLGDWWDFQKEYGEKLMLTRAVSLKNAMMYAGIEFEGQQHDALWDARNTATLLRIVRDPKLCKNALDKVIEILTPKALSTSLGDLFDFSQFAGMFV